ncbi:MAG: GyrI-like domain-containing protein [Vicinamibacterales bacterium]|nr:GyrI-like domain-containing protein [Vicinamibacterales bacterium]
MPDRDPVDDVLRRNTEVEIPTDVEARMRQQFADFRSRLDQRRHPVREWATTIACHWPYRWAAAGAVLAAVLAVVFVWGGTDGGRVYAAAVSRLANARSVQYTIELAPFVTVGFSHGASGRERVVTSWGIEIRADGSGTQLVLLHGSKQYVREQNGAAGVMRTADLIEQLTSLPTTADTALGERTVGGRRFVGYRVLGARMRGEHGVESLDLWLDEASGRLDHVDVSPAGAGASGYQMHIRDIRVDADVDPALFDMTPPPGYSDARSADAAGPHDPRSRLDLAPVPPRVMPAAQQPALVIPMRGSYLQASAAAAIVAQHLQQRGIAPAGPPFGRFESEAHWDVGYPVPAGTVPKAPFELVTLPGGSVASLVVEGPWGQQSAERWSRLLAWLGDNGYVAVGPPTEAWSGDASDPRRQVTEMRIAVVSGRR